MSTYIEPMDGQPRCNWCGGAPEFLPYHDNEWGFPVEDDIRLFEKLCLESFQSGLSWRTILNKRENFRGAFKGFDFHQVAGFDEQDIQRLLQDAGIIRHRGKIEAVINNAKRAIELIEREGSLASYFWRFEEIEPDTEQLQMRSTSSQSEALSKALKKQGWKFVGPTTVYAFMQAMGLVNDHAADCVTRQKVAQARQTFNKP
ncbi:DNA-3-methyladenine glycosylase I [Bowmanella yangjiangensis]